MTDVVKKRFWPISPLAIRILAVNIGALMTLVLGMLYTGQYERGLIMSELDALRAESRLLSAVLVQSATRTLPDGRLELEEERVQGLLRSLADSHKTRVLVFDRTGVVLVDSHQRLGEGGVVQMVSLNPLNQGWVVQREVRRVAEKILSFLPVRLRLPTYQSAMTHGAQGYPGVLETLSGVVNTHAWRGQDKEMILTVSVPVQGVKRVLGAVLLMRPGVDVDAVVLEAQFSVFKVFSLALLVTILLSIYLSETIVQPIVRLADATKKMQQSFLMKDVFPDLSWRNDEIGDLSRAFRELTDALSDRIDAISRFASDVAHEIKNPLASMQSAVETFSKVKDPVQQEKLLKVIQHDVDRLNRLITDISNASRMDSDLGRAERQALDVADLLKEIVAAEVDRIEDKEKVILHLVGNRKLRVTGNATQLGQVFHNLIDNALSFTPDGGKVEIHCDIENNKVIIHVDNEGPGIPENKLEEVFERFYSERPKEEKFGMHSGLGLSISRQIIRMHRGDITASNWTDALGKVTGVRFTVVIPAGAGT